MTDRSFLAADRAHDGAAASTPGTGARRSAAAPPDAALTRISSRDLFGRAREVLIEHDAQVYRLRRTALGKLILTK